MNKTPIIFDCDPGHDDAVALLIALASDAVEIKAITTAQGNQTIEKTTENALKILELCHRTEIPVSTGLRKPLLQKQIVAGDVHGKSGMDGPQLPAPVTKPSPLGAMEMMEKVISESPVPVTIVATGPFTNVAAFLLSHPHLKSKIECISVMGGGVWEGSRTAVAEFNIWNDPEAAQIVMLSGIPVILCGLDVTHKALIREDEFHLFREKQTPIHQFVADLLDFYSICYVKERKLAGCPMHDSCAMVSILEPDMFTYQNAHIEVDLDGAASRAGCVVDLRTPKRRGKPDNGKVALDVDRPRFFRLIMDSCDRLAAELEG